MKKAISVLLVLAMVFSLCLLTSAAPADVLQFDENGEFVIMHLCDCQDTYPANRTMLAFIRQTIRNYDPDIVILGGDNTVGPAETKELAIEELVACFVDNETYFSLVFGNHDNEQGVSDEELLAMYQKYGGEYCLAYDAVPALTGTATHNLPVLASDGSGYAFNLWLMDSNAYTSDAFGGGYDCVRPDQIDWYKNKAAALAAENGGEPIPAMNFQHIIVGECYDALFSTVPNELAVDGVTKTYYGKTYSFSPKLDKLNSGVINEWPCPGYFNFGQFDAMAETGDVIATFSGHDHVNTFSVTVDGIDIVNTPGASFLSYGNNETRGCRIITVYEDNPRSYDSRIVTIVGAVFDDGGEDLLDAGDVTYIGSVFSVFFNAFLKFWVKIIAFLQMAF